MIGRTSSLTGLSIVAALVFCAAPAEGEVYEYDFDSGRVIAGSNKVNVLSGQDNWTVTESITDPAAWHSIKAATSADGGAPHPGDGLLITEYGGNHGGGHSASRPNNGDWGFNLANDVEHPTQPGVMLTNTAVLAKHFALQWSLSTDAGLDYAGVGTFGIGGKSALQQDTSIRFGLNREQWYYGVCLWDTMGNKTIGTQPRPTARNQVWDLRTYIDVDDLASEGSASVKSMQYGTHTAWQDVGNLQDLPLYLDTKGFDIISAADTLLYKVAYRFTAADNLQVITPLRGDANLDYIVDGQDFTIMKSNFGSTSTVWADGDWNGDNVVDGQDFTWLKYNFGNLDHLYSVSRTTSPAPVPEPATMALLAIGTGAALLRRRRSD